MLTHSRMFSQQWVQRDLPGNAEWPPLQDDQSRSGIGKPRPKAVGIAKQYLPQNTMLDEGQIERKTLAFDVVSSEFSSNHSIEHLAFEGVSSVGKSDLATEAVTGCDWASSFKASDDAGLSMGDTSDWQFLCRK